MDASSDTVGINILTPIAYIIFAGVYLVIFIFDNLIADPTFFVLGGQGFIFTLLAQIIWNYFLICILFWFGSFIKKRINK